MSLRSRLRTLVRVLGRQANPEAEFDRELSSWVDELTARYETEGWPRQEARRRALAETGGVVQVREKVREARGAWPVRLSQWLRSDLATAIRSFHAAPVATATAILTLAIAVGLNLAMFALITRALLSPPAHVRDSSKVFTLALHGNGDPAQTTRTAADYPTFNALRQGVPELAAAALVQRGSTTVVIQTDQQSVNQMLVSDEYFELLGVQPAVGVGFVPNQDRPGPPVVVLSHAFWRSSFGGDRSAVGRHVNIGGLDYVVSGVMPAGFSGHSATAVDLWVPIAAAMRNSPGWNHDTYRSLGTMLVRLGPRATEASVAAQSYTAIGQRISLSSVVGAEVGATERRVAWWLGGVSLLVLVIGLANAGTLMVVRAARRRQEIAIRVALGATRGRLLSQVIIEAMLVALVATALSLLATLWFDELIRRVLFPGIVARSGFAVSVLWAALCAGALTAVVAAIANLWQFRSPTQAATLARITRGTGRTRTLKSLLLVQTTLSVVLLAGAGLFGRSLHNLTSQDFGMAMDDVVIVQFERPGPNPRDVFDPALEPIRALPGVELVTPVASVPFGGHHVPPISVPGLDAPPAVGRQLPFLNAATPEFMQILNIRVIDGRTFTASDEDAGAAPVVIVNETMARGIWPGTRAVGKCIRVGFDADFDPATSAGPPIPSAKVVCREVIGVARDIRQRSLLPVGIEARLMQYFVPFSQIPYPPFMPPGPKASGLLLRTRADLDSLAPAIRRLVVGNRTDVPFVQVAPYAQVLEPQLRPWRTATALLVLFSSLALSVAAVGLYAAFTHAVAERRGEMAIRVALGADPGAVLRMILREALMLAAIGASAGAIAAVVGGRWVQSLLFETAPSDPIVLGSAAALMLAVALGATFIPARLASKADPSSLMKER